MRKISFVPSFVASRAASLVTAGVAAGVSVLVLAAGAGCSGAAGSGFGHGGGGGSGGKESENGDGGLSLSGDSGSGGSGGNTSTTIYANSDTALYSVDPATKALALIGEFEGNGGSTITDVAVNAEGQVFVNSESAVYQAAVPSGAGPVPLTKVANIATRSNQYFYALAFAPPGVLGSGETLVGGDGDGELWSIDPTTGATQDLGSFGPDPHDSSRILGLSGDLVFYLDSSHDATGLATIRSCSSSGSCDSTSDYLAGIDMAALVGAYTSHTRAGTLLAGIYGGSSGSGTGYGELFGLAAWEGEVYAFSRAGSSGGPPPQLILIDTSSGFGTVVPSSPGFTSGGWSGAGVSTLTSITIPPPPK